MNKEDGNRVDELVRQGFSFVLRLALVLGGLGFASVFAVALLVGGIYLIATGHPSGGERTWVSDARRAWYFRSPERGPFAVLVDRADGYFPYPTKAEDFKGHRDPWLEHWKTRNRYRFETRAKTVSVVDVLGRESKVRAKDGSVELTLSGSPIAVYGLEM